MPQYTVPQEGKEASLVAAAHASFEAASGAGHNSNSYVRLTVIFASVLFLVGIGGHFAIKSARYGLIVIGSVLIAYSVVQLLTLPGPPS
jgi:hypothetical protein